MPFSIWTPGTGLLNRLFSNATIYRNAAVLAKKDVWKWHVQAAGSQRKLRCERAPVLVTDLRTVMNRSIFVRKKEIKVSQIESSKHKLNQEASG